MGGQIFDLDKWDLSRASDSREAAFFHSSRTRDNLARHPVAFAL